MKGKRPKEHSKDAISIPQDKKGEYYIQFSLLLKLALEVLC